MFRKQICLDMIDTTSKMSLKLSCLRSCDNDVKRANELYLFLMDGISDIPDFEPIKPSGFEQVKQGATEVFNWVSSHQDELAKGIGFFQSLKRPGSVNASDTVPPPIPKI